MAQHNKTTHVLTRQDRHVTDLTFFFLLKARLCPFYLWCISTNLLALDEV